MQKHVALDLDDVCLAFVDGVRAAVRQEYAVDLDRDAIDKFTLGPILDPIIGYSWWKWLRRRSWLWANFPAVEGAVGAVERLRAEGWYVEIVTSKPDWAEYAVWKWLGRWRLPVNRVTIVGQVDLKSQFTEAPILVDDKWENCTEFVASRPDRIALLFDQPHNREHVIGGNDRIFRAKGWPDTLEWLRAAVEK